MREHSIQGRALAVALLLATRSSFAETPSPDARPLEGTSWRLVQFRGSDDTTLRPDDGGKYTIEFGKDGALAARIDCNRGRSTWKASGPAQLELGPLALTRAQCPPGSLHDRMVKHWSYVRSYVVKDGHLFLSLMADGGIYEFEPAPGGGEGESSTATSATVEGPVWRLTRFLGPNGKALPELPRAPTLRFDAGRVEAFGGCNRLGGSYTLDGDRVTFGPIAGTMMACLEPMGAVEDAFKHALAGTVRFRVETGGLTLDAVPGPYPELTFVVESPAAK